MVAPKRMAVETEDDIVELGSVAPRRGVPADPFVGRKLARKALAPLAALSVAGLAAGLLMINPKNEAAGAVKPDNAASAMGVSRNEARAPLVAPSPSKSPSASASTSGGPSAAPSATPTGVASPTVPVSPTPSPSPTTDYTTVGKDAGKRYTTSTVNARKGGSGEFDVVATLSAGEEVTITNRVVNGWRQVRLAKGVGWVSEQYLAAQKPATKFSTEKCKHSSSIESSITQQTITAMRAFCGQFPSITTYGGYRAGSRGYHGSGQALDIMISGDAGWKVAYWAQEHAKELGINEVIYQQRIWTTKRSSEGWRWMADRGTVSANHYDHVHVSVAGSKSS